ncbi:MAG: STAS domain-containing protein [Candidatus Acidiferrum sp.]
MILNFTKRSLQPGLTALSIQGNIHCGPECLRLESEIDALIAAHETRIILDMAGVTHADSAAIGSMVKCLSKIKRAGGALRIAAAQPMINYSLKLTKVDQLIQMFPTVEQAAEGFAPSASVPNANPA